MTRRGWIVRSRPRRGATWDDENDRGDDRNGPEVPHGEIAGEEVGGEHEPEEEGEVGACGRGGVDGRAAERRPDGVTAKVVGRMTRRTSRARQP